jgi:signal transduction histidine kinase
MIKDRLKDLVRPKSLDEDLRRRELVLNILLAFSIASFTLINLIRLADLHNHGHDRGLPIIYSLLILSFFIFLRWLSGRGKIKTASWLLLLAYALPMFYSFATWGADLPAGLFLAVLIIALSGILIDENLVLISTLSINILQIVLTWLQGAGMIKVAGYWRSEPHELGDAIAYTFLSLIIAAIVWLFCRGIKRTLERARNSEAELKQERDQLEIKVRERTEQLRQAEAEKIGQLYRLAEFGRLSSGIFHDLINPLTAVSLNLNQAKKEAKAEIDDADSYINQAITAAHRMESLIAGIKKQIQKESTPALFSADEEIRQIIQILAYKANQARTPLNFHSESPIDLYGDAVKFGQIATNLLANAIEASEAKRLAEAADNTGADKEYSVDIELSSDDETVRMTVSDRGEGIAPENLGRIFEPFFSTKSSSGRGLGLGLASTKNIVEKDFSGSITVQSQAGTGSRFTVSLPIKQIENES